MTVRTRRPRTPLQDALDALDDAAAAISLAEYEIQDLEHEMGLTDDSRTSALTVILEGKLKDFGAVGPIVREVDDKVILQRTDAQLLVDRLTR